MNQTELLTIQTEKDMLQLRETLRGWAESLEFSSLQTTRLLTATSEIARNMLTYAEEGTAELTHISREGREGIRVKLRDEGPGIKDVPRFMQEGVRSEHSNGLGKGLSGAKKLVDRFNIDSEEGSGTRVLLEMWT